MKSDCFEIIYVFVQQMRGAKGHGQWLNNNNFHGIVDSEIPFAVNSFFLQIGFHSNKNDDLSSVFQSHQHKIQKRQDFILFQLFFFCFNPDCTFRFIGLASLIVLLNFHDLHGSRPLPVGAVAFFYSHYSVPDLYDHRHPSLSQVLKMAIVF